MLATIPATTGDATDVPPTLFQAPLTYINVLLAIADMSATFLPDVDPPLFITAGIFCHEGVGDAELTPLVVPQ